MKKLLTKEVCGSLEHYMRPTGVTHFWEIFAGQRDSESGAQCTGPTDSTVSHVKRRSQIKKKKKKRKTQWQHEETQSKHIFNVKTKGIRFL